MKKIIVEKCLSCPWRVACRNVRNQIGGVPGWDDAVPEPMTEKKHRKGESDL